MRIALPTAGGQLCMHFGHCEIFTLVDVDEKTKVVTATREVVPPPHEPGVLPKWLHEQGATVIIAGGMGMRAQQFFKEYGIQVVVGASSGSPQSVVSDWLTGKLVTGSNVCDH
ncbi:MAG: ATPase [Elusimicrobia bacterium RIFOXYB2_FULL_49_7]|nr:MAG: ATPase [Elusimicrobia bacterium RIFOXYB2_FULL_49_7]